MNNMKKIMALVLFLFMGLNAHTQGLLLHTGNDLIAAWHAFEKRREVPDNLSQALLNAIEVGKFEGYIKGLADIGDYQEIYYFPEGVTNLQICMVVGKYLDEHPEELHLRAFLLAHKALAKAFPPQK